MANNDLWSRPEDRVQETGEGWENNTQVSNSFQTYQENNGQTWNGRQNAVPFEQTAPFTGAAAETLSTYIGKTFLWMFAGLLVTALVAFGMVSSGMTFRMLYSGGTGVLIGVTIAEFAVVILMSARIRKMSVAAAAACFLIYAALTGVTFSMYFFLFDLEALVFAFGATALFFGGMAAVSLIFKMELSSIRPYLLGGLIFLIVFGVLSMIFNLGAFNTAICYVGIAIFLAYTAYDVSKIRAYYSYYAGQGEMLKKASIFSALQLYLDFINLFLYILRLFAKRK